MTSANTGCSAAYADLVPTQPSPSRVDWVADNQQELQPYYQLAPSKWGAREEPALAPWATIEETLSS
jgi:hypothetical protein